MLKYKLTLIIGAFALTVLAGQAASSNPVAAMRMTVPANGDATFGFPLHRQNVFTGAIASVNSENNVVTLSGSPGWTVNQFVNTGPHYLRIDSGHLEGASLTVVANDNDSLTVELDQVASISALADGDLISVIPYWTVGALIPAPPQGIELHIFDGDIAGINLANSRTLTSDNFDWYDATGQLANDFIIHPEESIVIRNHNGDDFEFILAGAVPMVKHMLALKTLAPDTHQDQRVVYMSPVATTIGEASFNAQNGDQLLSFSNSGSLFNKSAIEILTYYDGVWYDGMLQAVSLTYILEPGQGYIYRKAPTSQPEVVLWESIPGYLTQ